MSDELLSISISKRKSNWLVFFTFVPIIILAASVSNIMDWYKLLLVAALMLWLLTIAYRYCFYHPEKVDLLFAINNAIIWENNRTELYDIVKITSLSYFFTIIGIKNATQKTRYLLIVFNNIPATKYKALRRHIKWQPTSSN